MKRFFILMFAAIAGIFISGCGESGNKIKVGISIPSADHGWTGGVVWWAEQAKKSIEKQNPGVEVIISTARDATEQVDKVENLMVQGIKALVILPHESGPLTGICRQVKANGIYLVVVDRGLDEPLQDVLIAGDNAGFGREAAKTMAEALKGKGDIVVMEGIPCTVNSSRVDAFKEVMKNYPGIRILDSQSAGWNTEKGLALMENYLQKHKKIDAVWTGDDDVLTGALKAYSESGRKDIQLFVGGAGSKQIVKMVMDGNPLVPFDITYPPSMIKTGAEYAVAGALGKPLSEQKTVIIPAEVIRKDNAAEYYFPDSIF